MAAEAAGSGAWSHGVGLVLIRSLPYTLACTAKSASGMAGGFVGRQPVTLIRCYNSLNFAPTTPNIFLLPSKNPQKFPDHSPVIGVKIGIVEIDFVVENVKINSDGVT